MHGKINQVKSFQCILLSRSITVQILLMILCLGCGRVENKARDLGEQAKNRGRAFIDTAIEKVFPEPIPEKLSIRSIVPGFKNDKNIIEIRGVLVDHMLLYTGYCVYRGKKANVLNAVNRIRPSKTNDYTSSKNCSKTDKESFYKDVIPEEKTNTTAFFWNFEKLKSYDIYTCIKAPLRHYIIFDNHSDTVYHRVEEIRD